MSTQILKTTQASREEKSHDNSVAAQKPIRFAKDGNVKKAHSKAVKQFAAMFRKLAE